MLQSKQDQGKFKTWNKMKQFQEQKGLAIIHWKSLIITDNPFQNIK